MRVATSEGQRHGHHHRHRRQRPHRRRHRLRHRQDANSILANDQAFAWIGTAAFAGTGAASAGHLRFDTLSPGVFAILGDVNVDGTVDFACTVASTFTPQAGWFFA